MSVADTSSSINPILLWHERFAHSGVGAVVKTAELVYGMTSNLSKLEIPNTICSSCAAGKQTYRHSAFEPAGERSKNILELVHVDLGESNILEVFGCKYWFTIIDDYSRMSWVILMKHKNEAFEALREWITWAEKQKDLKVKAIQSDKGGEIFNKESVNYFASRGIHHYKTVTNTPEQDGVVECFMRVLGEGTRALLAASGLPQNMWGFAMRVVSYVRNRMIHTKHKKTPWEVFYGEKPDVSNLRVFGSTAFLHVHDNKRKKMDLKSKKLVMVGYSQDSGQKGYQLFDLETEKVQIGSSRDVIFDEATFIRNEHRQLSEDELGNENSNGDLLNVFEEARLGVEEPKAMQGGIMGEDSEDEDSFEVQPEIHQEVKGKSVAKSEVKPKEVYATPVLAELDVDGGGKLVNEARETAKVTQRVVQVEPHPESARPQRVKRPETLWKPGYDPITGITSQVKPKTTGSSRSSTWFKTPAESSSSSSGNRSSVRGAKLNAMYLIGNIRLSEDTEITSDILGRVNVITEHVEENYIPAVEREFEKLVQYDFAEKVTEEEVGDEKVLESRLVMNEKTLPDGSMKYKARLVVRGYQQELEQILAEVYSPVGSAESLRYLLAHAAQMGWTLEQMDFDTAFLQSDPLSIEEQVLICLPKGLPNQVLGLYGWNDGQVMRLKKPLYGLKRSPLLWHKSIATKMKLIGYKPVEKDSCLYVDEDHKLYMFLHVDDLLMTAEANSGKIEEAKELLQTRFDFREDGFPELFLGIQIQQTDNGAIFIHQARYIQKVLERFGELEGKIARTPMELGAANRMIEYMQQDQERTEEDRMLPYREFIGAMMWLAKGTRPDLLQSVSLLSRYQENYGMEQWKLARRVFAYLRGTMEYGILYTKDSDGPFNMNGGEIVGYADANWAETDMSRRSTTGYAFGLANGAIAYVSRRQKTVALSSTEAEIYAMTDAAKEASFLRSIVYGLKGEWYTMELLCDNQSAIEVGNSTEYNRGRTKHIDVRNLYIKDAIQEGILEITWVESQENVADILTKPLSYPLFNKHRDGLGVKTLPADME